MTSGKRDIIGLILLILITIAVYHNVIKLGFVNWDDGKYVYENSDIRQLNLKSAGSYFTTPYVGMYQPLPMFTYALEYYFFENNPVIYHLTNLLFHILNVLLLFRLIKLMIRNDFVAFFTALVFAVHPLHVESVAWISERKDVMFAFFYFLSLIYYLKYLEKPGRKRNLWLSLICFTFSLLSKSAAVTLPFILLLIDNYRSEPLSKKSVFNKLPFFTLSIIFGIVSLITQQAIRQDLIPVADFTFIDKIFLASASFSYYLISFLFPFDLSAFHPFPIKAGDFLPFKFYFTILIPVVFLVCIVVIFRSNKIAVQLKKNILFGLLFFLITLFLYIYIPVGSALVSERYTYLPYIGTGLILMVIAEHIMKRYESGKHIRVIVLFVLILLCGFFAVLSHNRVAVWKDSTALWMDAVKKDPSMIGYYNLGNAYRETKDYNNALTAYQKSLQINPAYADAWNNTGVTLADLKQYSNALFAFEKAHSLRPQDKMTLLNRANNYRALGRNDHAITDYNHLIEMDSANAEVFFQRGTLHMTNGNLVKALVDINKSIALNPEYAEAYNFRGYIGFLTGNLKDAERDIKKAIELNPHLAETYINLSRVSEAKNNKIEALKYLCKAIEIDNTNTTAYFNRSVLFSGLNNLRAAMNDLDIVIKLNPDYYQAYNNRADIKIKLHDLKGALNDMNKMLLLKPDFGNGYYSRAIIKRNLGLFDEACTDMHKASKFGATMAEIWLKEYCK